MPLQTISYCYRTDLGEGGEQNTITEWISRLVLWGSPHPVLGSPCPPPGKDISQCQIGEKERDYLFKELYKLMSNDLMSSLKY